MHVRHAHAGVKLIVQADLDAHTYHIVDLSPHETWLPS